MAITKTKRTEETRESTSKIETSSFEEEKYFDIPEAVKNKFDSSRYDFKDGLGVALNGEDDYKNVGKRQREGWTFVSPEEVPELASSSIVRKMADIKES